MEKKFDYKSAGVDVKRGYEAVDRMKKHIAKTLTDGVLGSVGGFGGLFKLPGGYEKPVLVSGTDGVGTKLKLAFDMDIHDTVGVDLVAMCANDIIAQGAKPLFFLDYIGTGRLLPERAEQIVKGVSDGCIQAGCALIGGETAEMPGFYEDGEYDMAGFCVGIVEEDKIITGEKIKENDVLIGIRSTGVHSNGFSLVRKLCFEIGGYKLSDIPEGFEKPLGEVLLTPTKIYVDEIMGLINEVDINGIAHITGGGWTENIPRMLPKNLSAEVSKNSDLPAIFPFLQKLGNLDDIDMYSTFNMGVGMVLAVDKENEKLVLENLNKREEIAFKIGEVKVKKDGGESIVFL